MRAALVFSVLCMLVGVVLMVGPYFFWLAFVARGVGQ